MLVKILITIALLALLANFGYSLYNLVVQIQTKDVVKDSWGWIILRVIAVLGSLNVLRTLWMYKNGY
jgi:hypothetical protein